MAINNALSPFLLKKSFLAKFIVSKSKFISFKLGRGIFPARIILFISFSSNVLNIFLILFNFISTILKFE
jgi:hypothetical protein